MSFSREWEQRFAENTHISVWPWSDLVSLVRRHCKQLGPDSKVLELGCGAGANIPFFQSLAVQYHALEGSPSVVRLLHQRFPELVNNIRVADFTAEQPFNVCFDVVVDRAALTCNTTAAICSALDFAWQTLKPGGYYIGVDWYSMQHSEYQRGEPDTDIHTRHGYVDGMFSGLGPVHFSDADHLMELFSRFDMIFLEEKILRRFVPEDDYQFASWHVVARKPIG
jgi:SAM-dependent methyltransferase